LIFANAPVYHSGGIVGEPAILKKGELVLDENRQENLMTFLASSNIDRSGSQNINMTLKVEGGMKSNKNDFVMDFDRAQKEVTKLIGAGRVEVYNS